MQFLIPQFKFTARSFEELQRQLEKMYDDVYREVSRIDSLTYVDRGDPAAVDFAVGVLTTDGNYHDLDLSSIVPAGAKAVHIKCVIEDDVAEEFVTFRENGNSNEYNNLTGYTQVANVLNVINGFVSLDSNRIIEYAATSATWTLINILVRGWLI